MAEVLIVNMPFSSLRWPALGPSLLQAALHKRAISCDLAYLQFELAEAIGHERYEWINDAFGFVLGGDRLFAPHVFGQAPTSLADYAEQVLRVSDPQLSDADLADYASLATPVAAFLDAAFHAVDWSRYAVVGFTTTFQQTLASIALAMRVKQTFPHIWICLGGANAEGEMGRELLQHFPAIDYVFSGEADTTFPEVVSRLLAREPFEPPPGVLDRARLEAAPDLTCRCLVADLDTLPVPTFDDYFTRLSRSPLNLDLVPVLLFESSRGCWWGQSSHCAFCGLNGGGMAFRSKSPARVIDELRLLRSRYGLRQACATDNILDHRYYRSLLPQLAAAGIDLDLEYELKSNLTRDQVDRLAAAGVRAAQLGVESLSTPILERLRKGTTAVQNIQSLKWLAEAGIAVKWNWLHHVPGETAADYEHIPDLIARLAHLPPPQAVGPIRFDRFSPYFDHPASFGLPPLQPAPAYRHVFPFDTSSLARLAYYFVAPRMNSPVPAAPTIAAVEAWQTLAGTATLRALDQGDDGLLIVDTRPIAAAFQRRLKGLERDLYIYCDQARKPAAILDHARTINHEFHQADLESILEAWLRSALAIESDGRILALATRGNPT